MKTSAISMVIVGRPNVGKSTLFNRLIGRRRSIVTDEPGITRDRIVGEFEWQGQRVELVDTGGLVPDDDSLIAQHIFAQARQAIARATQVLLVVDGRAGLTPLDEALAQCLRKANKPTALVVNKIEMAKQISSAQEFHRLGFEKVFFVSAEHSVNIDDMLDEIFAQPHFPSITEKQAALQSETHAKVEPREQAKREGKATGRREDEIRVAIIGRPNVGKSTLLNRLCGEERVIVTPMPGTTRDSVDEVVRWDGCPFRFIDTAGIRRKGRTKLLAEKLSVVLARKHLEQSDVALMLIDAVEGMTALDATIAGYAAEAGKSVILVVNKWDALQKTSKTRAEFERRVRARAKFLDYAPIQFISALTGQRVAQLFPLIQQVATERAKKIPTSELNQFFHRLNQSRATLPRSQQFKILYATQVATAPPIFLLFTQRKVKMHFAFERFLENRLREQFGFIGSPIRLKQRAKSR